MLVNKNYNKLIIMRKINKTLKNLVAFSLLIALGFVGLELKVDEPFTGIESIEISTSEASAEVWHNVQLETAFCSLGRSYKRCWTGAGTCDTDDQTFCPEPT
jgi:hypothetical protein